MWGWGTAFVGGIDFEHVMFEMFVCYPSSTNNVELRDDKLK